MPPRQVTPPAPAAYAEVRETHTAVVLLMGDRAYKIKKPVNLGFLDFSTPRRRTDACVREVALNRRMAPDVYLGTGELSRPDGPTETVVVMRRMPDALRLSALVDAGVPVEEPLRRLARDLATFHAAAAPHPALQIEAGRGRLLGRWHDSIAQLRALGGVDAAVVEHVAHLVERFLAGRGVLFGSRIEDGHVVDGHGDLQADDVFCLPDGPRALDCLEFDDALRHVDQLDDAAFLAMDLEHLGAPELGAWFLDRYAEYSGDPAPASLRHHYLAYRAFVRAKVCAVRAAQGDPQAAATAAAFAEIAVRHLALGAVRLVLVGGLPGTGKSTLGGLLADEHGFVLLSSDRLRKETAGLSPEAHAAARYGEGLYSDAATERTYAELLRRAGLLLAMGESVVLDASWTSEDRRREARRLASDLSADLTELCCYAPAAVAAQRLLSRPAGASDADEVVAARMAADDAAWPSAVVIATTGSAERALEEASAAVLAPGRLGSHAVSYR